MALDILRLLSAAALWEGHAGRWPAVAAAVIMIGIIATFFVYFGKANASFASASIAAGDVPAELARWSAWHSGRTAFSIIALLASLWSLAR